MNKRTIFIVIFTIFLSVVLLTPVADETAYAASPSFTDVSRDYWGSSYISFAAEVGIVNGYPMANGSFQFRPDNSVSKEESMQMLYKAITNSEIGPPYSQELLEKYETQLKESGIAAWAWECVAYGLENGILEASELEGFRTSSGDTVPAIREDVARWTGKAIDRKLMPATALDYIDADQILRENLVYVDLLNRMKIMIGDSKGKFNPKSNIRRVEFAVICNRVYALAEADFDLNTENAYFQGRITGVNIADSKIYLDSLGGGAGIIHLEDKIQIVINGKLAYNSFKDIPTGKKAVLAWGPFDQLHIATEVVSGEAVIEQLTPIGDACFELELRTNKGESIYYYIDGRTSIIDELKDGQDVIFIADGVKIIEIADKK